GKTAADNYIVIATGDNETSEVYLLPADNPEAPMQLVSARQKGREYSVDERDGTLYILTNDEHPNFRVATASVKDHGRWTTLIPSGDHSYIPGFAVLRDYFVLESREERLVQVDIRT